MMMFMFFPLILSLAFASINHPMLMVTIIIMQTMLMCCSLWVINTTSWFSFILFLVFLGGLMVLFIYICSLAPNEMFKIKLKMETILALIIAMMVVSEMKTEQVLSFSNSIFKMMLNHSLTPTVTSMFYLLGALIIVVKITSNKMSPLRMKKS